MDRTPIADSERLNQTCVRNCGKRDAAGGRKVQDEAGRRTSVITEGIRPRFYWLVKDPKARANGCFVIRKRIVGKADSWIEIRPIRILSERVPRHGVSAVGQRVQWSFEGSPAADRVGGKIPPEAEIQHQFRQDLPVILQVREEVDLSKATRVIKTLTGRLTSVV